MNKLSSEPACFSLGGEDSDGMRQGWRWGEWMMWAEGWGDEEVEPFGDSEMASGAK